MTVGHTDLKGHISFFFLDYSWNVIYKTSISIYFNKLLNSHEVYLSTGDKVQLGLGWGLG